MILSLTALTILVSERSHGRGTRLTVIQPTPEARDKITDLMGQDRFESLLLVDYDAGMHPQTANWNHSYRVREIKRAKSPLEIWVILLDSVEDENAPL